MNSYGTYEAKNYIVGYQMTDIAGIISRINIRTIGLENIGA